MSAVSSPKITTPYPPSPPSGAGANAKRQLAACRLLPGCSSSCVTKPSPDDLNCNRHLDVFIEYFKLERPPVRIAGRVYTRISIQEQKMLNLLR